MNIYVLVPVRGEGWQERRRRLWNAALAGTPIYCLRAPGLIKYDIDNIQPMSGNLGKIFSLRPDYTRR